MSRISGDVSHDSRILVYDNASQELVHDDTHSAGSYEITGLVSGEKVVTAVRTSDDKALSYGGVTPYLENIEIQKSVITGDDDGWYSQTSHWNPDGTAIYVYYTGGGPLYKGWARFADINVSQGQTLQSATLRFYFENSLGSGKTGRFYFHDADNSATPSSRSEVNGRTRTSAYTQPTINHSPVGGYVDVDVLSPVQEVINRGGWSPGNAVTTLIDPIDGDSSSYLYFSAYESSRTEPRLTLVYEG